MGFTSPGSVYIFQSKKGSRYARYYFCRTVGESESAHLKELTKRTEEGLYEGTDLIAAQAIIASGGKTPHGEQHRSAGQAANAFLVARRHLKDEGFEYHRCEEF